MEQMHVSFEEMTAFHTPPLRIRTWSGCQCSVLQAAEYFFYPVLTGGPSPLMLHPRISERLRCAAPSSCRILECTGAPEAVLTYLAHLPDLQRASVVLTAAVMAADGNWDSWTTLSETTGETTAHMLPHGTLHLCTSNMNGDTGPDKIRLCLLLAGSKAPSPYDNHI